MALLVLTDGLYPQLLVFGAEGARATPHHQGHDAASFTLLVMIYNLSLILDIILSDVARAY